MWYIRNQKLGTIYYIILSEDPYVVGRSGADLIISGDSSVSRTHAKLKLNAKNKLEVVDCGSKYGTYVNEGITTFTQIEPQKPVFLKSNDHIMFGRLDSKWTVVNANIVTVISTLPENTKVELNKIMAKINGSISNEFSEKCTHLTMPVLSITMKVLLSLTAGIPIVAPEYWNEYLKCVQKKQKLIDYKNYLPPLNESFLRTTDLNLDINLKRKSIFAGKKFIFMLSKHMSKYELVIQMAGGTCTHLGQKLSKSELTKGDTVVIQYIPTGHTQTQQSQSLSDCEKVYAILEKNGKRAIPDVEIGLAIIHCSLEKYCNPEAKVLSTENVTKTTLDLRTSTLLANDTPLETHSKDSKEFTSSCEVPDSEVVKKTSKGSGIALSDSSIEEMENNLNVLDIESETTQKFVVPEATNKSSKRKNDSTDMSKNKRINLEDDIESTSSPDEPLESFVAKKSTAPLPPMKPTAVTTAKRSFSTRSAASSSDNENDDLFCFKQPNKKSKQTDCAKDNPFLDGEFNFKRKARSNRASTSQSSLAASCSFLTQNTPEQVASDSIDGRQRSVRHVSNDSQADSIDLSDYIKPVNLNTGTWLSSEFVKSMNIKSNQSTANDSSVKDVKPNETDLWIESMKGCVKVENTAIVLNNSDNVYYKQNLNNVQENSKNKKNFKAFKKIINYKKQNVIVNCKPIIVD